MTVIHKTAVAEEFASGRRQVQIIFSDVDGTLMSPEHRLTEDVVRAQREAQRAGVPLVLATGKSVGPWLDEALPKLDLHLPRIHMQGLLVCRQDGTVLRSLTLEPELVLETLALLEPHGVTTVVYTSTSILCSRLDRHVLSLVPYGEPYPKEVPGNDLAAFLAVPEAPSVHKVVVIADPEKVPGPRAALEQALGDRISVTSALANMAEVLPLGASKGGAVLWLLEHLGLDPANAMACGDGENDLEMLRDVGIGVAMANAVPELKSVADAETASNVNSGVARAIETFVLKPRGIALA